jgi:hypothetical protein
VSAQVGEDDAVSACGKGVCVPVIEPLAAGGEEPVEEQDGWAGADLAIGELGTVAAGESTDRWFDRPCGDVVVHSDSRFRVFHVRW